ncbi:MAG: hypothetical protein NWF01_09875 [Candidatus Bathyarchaeota archaeon]|nr:hypothetical protein [Candidatus Bathyarchaeota archaeon]
MHTCFPEQNKQRGKWRVKFGVNRIGVYRFGLVPFLIIVYVRFRVAHALKSFGTKPNLAAQYS